MAEDFQPYMPICYGLTSTKHKLWICVGLTMLSPSSVVFSCEHCGRTFFFSRWFLHRTLVKR